MKKHENIVSSSNPLQSSYNFAVNTKYIYKSELSEINAQSLMSLQYDDSAISQDQLCCRIFTRLENQGQFKNLTKKILNGWDTRITHVAAKIFVQ